ncbi:MAG TPA: hypothetical protein VF411_01350 [Bacteroidia bacterium]
MLQLAFDNETKKLVSIYQVDTGTDCNCRCSCGEPLIAKNNGKEKDKPLLPNQKDAHFAHKGDCGETDIHLLAKETLKQNKKLRIYYYKKEDNSIVFKSKTIEFDVVEIPSKLFIKDKDKIIPDAILKKKDREEKERTLFIEFKYTHEVDTLKKEKIKRIGINTLEIDLTLNDINPIKEDGTPNLSEMQTFLENYGELEYDWILNNEDDELSKKYKEELEKAKSVERNRIPTFIGQQSEELKINKDYKKIEDQKKLEDWGERIEAMGYINKKVYSRYDKFVGQYDNFVYCPKYPRNKNEIPFDECKICNHNYNGKPNTVYKGGEKGTFCNYDGKIKI